MKIAVLPGDGIGPEVIEQALRVLQAASRKFQFEYQIEKGLIGGAAFDQFNSHLPEATLVLCKNSDAILFGSVGGPIAQSNLPKWKNCEVNALLGIRKAFSFYANLRPCDVYASLAHSCPLRSDLIEGGTSILIVRELLGDIYFGQKTQEVRDGKRHASDLCEYDENQIAAIARIAFKAATIRKNHVYSVDKANVLATSKLWRAVLTEVAQEFNSVKLDHMLVDNCAMQLVRNPKQFDVIVTSNMFGDILSDLASVLPGSLGMTPSASLNAAGFGLYEPSGGSAPDIAGKGIANPSAQILSLAMMFRFSFNKEREADAIELAVRRALEKGARTSDIAATGETSLSSQDFTSIVIENL